MNLFDEKVCSGRDEFPRCLIEALAPGARKYECIGDGYQTEHVGELWILGERAIAVARDFR